MSKKNKPVDMKLVAQDIITIQIKRGESLSNIMNKFYAVMRKHGIKQGIKVMEGKKHVSTTKCNFEWTMSYELFKSTVINNFFVWENLLKCPKEKD